MKKGLFLIVCIIGLFMQPIHGQVTKPASGDQLQWGDLSSIDWVYFSASALTFTIELRKGGQLISSEPSGPTAPDAQGVRVMLWTVPNVTPGNDYSIRVIPSDGGNTMTSGVFSIDDGQSSDPPPIPADYLEVVTPNGGEYFTQDRPIEIVWHWKEDGAETFTFSLSGSGTSYFLGNVTSPAQIVVDDDGVAQLSQSFNIPVDVSDGNYTCQISSAQRSDGSDATFFVGPIPDKLYNRVEAKTFTYINGQQVTLSSGKTYFDTRGKLLQSQSKNMTENKAMATQPVYDQYDRVALETLPAPTGETQMSFKKGFITVNNEEYNNDHIAQSTPDAVDNGKEGTVGWYYSNNNTLEPHTAVSKYPFSRTEFYNDGTGEVKRSTGPGDVFHENNNRKVSGKAFPVLNDLNQYYKKVRELLFDQTIADYDWQFVKTVSTDANGNEVVSYMDGNEQVLASGYGYLDGSMDVGHQISYDANVTAVSAFDFHVPAATSVNYTGGSIRNLLTNAVETSSQLNRGYYRCEGCTSINYSFTYYNMSFNFYDNRGRMILSVPPRGVDWLISNIGSLTADQVQWTPDEVGDVTLPFATYYDYDFEGRLLASKEPDAGIAKYKYRTDGSIRFSQNALQRESGHFSYTNYDDMVRPVESGEYIGSNFDFDSNLDGIVDDIANDGGLNLTIGDRKDWVKTFYDLPDSDETSFTNQQDPVNVVITEYNDAQSHVTVPMNGSITIVGPFDTAGRPFVAEGGTNSSISTPNFSLPGDQDYTYGAVSYTESEDAKTWYSYDELGRVKWVATWYKWIFDAPKVVEYTYDFIGNVKQVKYQEGKSDAFYHSYTYDADNRLSAVYADDVPITSQSQEKARYEYYLHGPLKRVELAFDVQGIDYYYTIQGWLKSINDPGNTADQSNFQPDAFAQAFHYFKDDYDSRSRTSAFSGAITSTTEGSFDGNIARLTRKVKSHTGSYLPNTTFRYTYDHQNQLLSASQNGTNNFKVNNLVYDPNGNIESLRRYNGTGVVLHDLDHRYDKANTNQLTSVGNYATSYTYDAIGQMTSQVLINGPTLKPVYSVSGKVEEVFGATDAIKLAYGYDDKGFRIRKKDYEAGGKETIYVRDASGQLLSTYIREVGESAYTQEETPVYGSSRLGLWQHQSSGNDDLSFELKDHLGNVRAKMSLNTKAVTYYADYYPFGSVMQEGNAAERGKYGYQGDFAEKDEETGWNHFELREYDPIVGKWLSVDPKRVGFSPYIGYANNPVYFVDPDGGEPFPLVAFIQWEGRGSFMITMAQAVGLAGVYENGEVHWALYDSKSLGVGINLGVTGGLSGGLLYAPKGFDSFSGLGYSAGAYATAGFFGGGINGAVEINAPIKDNGGFGGLGVTLGIPIAPLTVGAGGGFYSEGTYTNIIGVMSTSEIVDSFLDFLKVSDPDIIDSIDPSSFKAALLALEKQLIDEATRINSDCEEVCNN